VIVCSCNVLSDHAVRRSASERGACPFRLADVFADLSCRPQCGRCAQTIRRIVRESAPTLSDDPAELVAAE